MPPIVIRHEVYLHPGRGEQPSFIEEVLDQLGLLRQEIKHMSQELDALQAAVAHNTTVDQSVITLVKGLAQQLRDVVANNTELADMKAAVTQMAADLESSNQAVADAVTENTPTTPPTP